MNDVFKQKGAFSWNELMTTDIEAAKRFYAELFGWRFELMNNLEDVDYHVISVGETPIGGIMGMPPETGDMPPAWGSYVTVDDVDAVAAQAKQLGGQVIVEPRDIPEVGRFCVILDPQGAMISAASYTPCDDD
jgi:hypothetical protein